MRPLKRHGSLLPIVAFGPGHVANQVGQDPLLFADLLELGGLLGGQLLVAALHLVEGLGPLIDLLLKRLEHLELGGRRNPVAATAATRSTTAAPSTAAAASTGSGARPVGFERLHELFEAIRGGLGGVGRLVVGL